MFAFAAGGFALIANVIIWSTIAFADQQADDDWSICDTFTTHIENDEFGGTDRNYSGGARFTCVRSAPRFFERRLRSFLSKDAISQHKFSYGFGQNTYTPDDLAEPELIEDDQPYAGWLYLDFGLESEVKSASGDIRYLDNFGLQLGVVGPLSGAEQLQRFSHDVLNATDPVGWDNQLDNEPGINLFYSRQWTGIQRFALPIEDGPSSLDLDLTPEIGAAVGNIYTLAGGGLMLRLGKFPENDHGPPSIRPSFPGSDDFPRVDGWSGYIFGSVEGRAVARNIFLDGNSFDDDSPSVDKNTLVGEARLGVNLIYSNLRVAYQHVFRSQEFEGQEPQIYGGVTISVRL